MYQSIHNVKQIVRGEIREINDNYSMKITIIYDELGYCNQRKGDLTIFGNMELETQLTLFAETKEALELKAEALA
jgi:hypothetical protein|tara:strand:- start:440 stop:664 length:225 start_codon:yes stop_codon:yes gene_type:complete